MTDTPSNILPGPSRIRHQWTRWPTIPASESASGCEEHRRTCDHCRINLTTYIPPSGRGRDIYRRWSRPDGSPIHVAYGTPPCVPVIESQSVA
jgi:hypothetical protein